MIDTIEVAKNGTRYRRYRYKGASFETILSVPRCSNLPITRNFKLGSKPWQTSYVTRKIATQILRSWRRHAKTRI